MNLPASLSMVKAYTDLPGQSLLTLRVVAKLISASALGADDVRIFFRPETSISPAWCGSPRARRPARCRRSTAVPMPFQSSSLDPRARWRSARTDSLHELIIDSFSKGLGIESIRPAGWAAEILLWYYFGGGAGGGLRNEGPYNVGCWVGARVDPVRMTWKCSPSTLR